MFPTLIMASIGLLVLIGALGFVRWLWKQEDAHTQDLLELFELRERMSNAAFQSSVQHSLCLLKANPPISQ